MIDRVLTFFSLKGLIILGLFCVGILPLIGLVSITLPTITEKIEQLTELERVAELEDQVAFLETTIEHRKADLRTITALPGTAELFSDPASQVLDPKKIQQRMTFMLKRWLPAEYGVKAIILINNAGKVINNWEMNGDGVLSPKPLTAPTLSPETLQDWHRESKTSGLNQVYVAGIEQEFINKKKQHSHFPRLILGIPGKNKDGAYGGAIFMKISLASFVNNFPYDFIVTGTGEILHRYESNHTQEGQDNHSHITTFAHEAFPDLQKVDPGKSHLILPNGHGQKMAFVRIVQDHHPDHTLWLAHEMDRGELERWLNHFHLRFAIILAILILLSLILAMGFASKLGRLHRELVSGLNALIQTKKPISLKWRWPSEVKKLSEELTTLSQNLIESDLSQRQSEKFLKSILNGIQDGISVHDRDYNVLQTNHCLEKWFEDKLPLAGKKCYEIFHDRQTPCESCPSFAAFTQNTIQRSEMVSKMADGREKWLEIFAYPVRDENDAPLQVVEFIRDITEKKQAETQRDHLLSQLAFSQKMEAVGTLAGGVAHDFNNILSAINGYASICLGRMAKEDPLREKVNIILESGQRAARLTQQLLAFSRKQVISPQDVNVDESLKGIKKMLGRILGEDIEITIISDPELWHIHADQTQFEQVLINLAVNARDAMPKGGKLTFESKNIVLDQAYVEKHYEIKAGKYVLIAISDSGEGMDKETLSKIFEPFFTTKEKGKGTGLGLATVYGIIKQSQGEILVYSEPGQGTCFKIYLPQYEKGSSSEVQEITPDSAAHGTETILLVEDDEVVRTMTVEVLLSLGYSVLEATNGVEALQTCKRYHGHIDLLLTDVVMPQMGGSELAQKIDKLRPGLKIIFMSGYTDDAVVRHGILQDNVQFLQKPVSPGTLSKTLRTVLDQSHS